MKPFVFLDRDGTLIVEKNYLSDPEGVVLIDGAAAALRRLHENGYGIAVVTNQSGVARGYFDPERVDAIHDRLRRLLADEGAAVDAIYICPHTPEDACGCRKPLTGMLDAALRDHDVDLGRSFMIGDKAVDLDFGTAAGLTSILVRTGYGRELEPEIGTRAAFVAEDLGEAVEWILSSKR